MQAKTRKPCFFPRRVPRMLDAGERLARLRVGQEPFALVELGHFADQIDGRLRQGDIAGLAGLRVWNEPGLSLDVDVLPFGVQQFVAPGSRQQEQPDYELELGILGSGHSRMEPLGVIRRQIALPRVAELAARDVLHRIWLTAGDGPLGGQFE